MPSSERDRASYYVIVPLPPSGLPPKIEVPPSVTWVCRCLTPVVRPSVPLMLLLVLPNMHPKNRPRNSV